MIIVISKAKLVLKQNSLEPLNNNNLSQEHRFMSTSRRYITQQVIVNALVNFFLALLISWGLMGSLEEIPIWFSTENFLDPSVIGDIVVGSFLLGLIFTVIVTQFIRADLKKGKVNDLSRSDLQKWIPQTLFARALVFGVLCMLVGSSMAGVILALDIDSVRTADYIVLHAIYIGALVCPLTVAVVKCTQLERRLDV